MCRCLPVPGSSILDCACPGWRYRRGRTSPRMCKHLRISTGSLLGHIPGCIANQIHQDSRKWFDPMHQKYCWGFSLDMLRCMSVFSALAGLCCTLGSQDHHTVRHTQCNRRCRCPPGRCSSSLNCTCSGWRYRRSRLTNPLYRHHRTNSVCLGHISAVAVFPRRWPDVLWWSEDTAAGAELTCSSCNCFTGIEFRISQQCFRNKEHAKVSMTLQFLIKWALSYSNWH